MKWCFVAVLFSVGCTTDNEPGNPAPAPIDAGLAFDAPLQDAAPERLTVDGFIDLFDAFPVPDGPVGTCIGCVRDRCGAEVNRCANDALCRQGLACALATCVAMPADGGAGPDPVCLLGCFMGNLAALASAGGAFGCISMNCAASCAPAGATDSGIVGD
jgi:hypothetical protein